MSKKKNCAKEELTKALVSKVSKNKLENSSFLDFRLKAYEAWKLGTLPNWSSLTIPKINYNDYLVNDSLHFDPKKSKSNLETLKIFKKLGVSFKSKKTAIDAILNSASIKTTFQKKLAKIGVIFCPISESIFYYPKLVQKFLGRGVPFSDNYFAALNSSIFTDGSFCYASKKIKSPLNLSTYFYINNEKLGQFERTLIVAEKAACISYVEGCTAQKYSTSQLHAAVVELYAFEEATIKYSTIQNWYPGDAKGIGGVYNFVTKRGLCLGKNSNIIWTQLEAGSSITWKYPGCVLIGDYSKGEFYSIAITDNFQQADTGTKMIHFGKGSCSKVASKGLSLPFSKNTYRGLVKICASAYGSKNYSECDSFLVGQGSTASAYPYFDVCCEKSCTEHEARVSKLDSEQIFYLMQRGLSQNQAISFIVNGFCKDVLAALPAEFLAEAKSLIFNRFSHYKH